MQINATSIGNLFRGFHALFMESLQGCPGIFNKIAVIMPSSTAEEIYAWLNALPNMRELVGSVVINDLGASDYRIRNKEYEATVALKEADIERDRLGLYNSVMSSLGIAAGDAKDFLTALMLEGGFTIKDYTGTPFFAANKPHEPNNAKSAKFSNLLTAPLSADSYSAAKANLKGRKNSQNRPMGLGRKLILVVPPALETLGQQILETEFVMQTAINTAGTPGAAVASAAVSNVNKGSAELVVWSQLGGSDTAWFLLEVGLPIKPLVFQLEQDVKLLSLTQPDSDHVFKNHEYLYQAYGRWAVGYGLPQLAVGSTGEG